MDFSVNVLGHLVKQFHKAGCPNNVSSIGLTEAYSLFAVLIQVFFCENNHVGYDAQKPWSAQIHKYRAAASSLSDRTFYQKLRFFLIRLRAGVGCVTFVLLGLVIR